MPFTVSLKPPLCLPSPLRSRIDYRIEQQNHATPLVRFIPRFFSSVLLFCLRNNSFPLVFIGMSSGHFHCLCFVRVDVV
ncbi:hypothetical protein K1719_010939 [Acacia pycnantha]|nr:hypothetical protein K1719_010939 [Acacia pycnantha]